VIVSLFTLCWRGYVMFFFPIKRMLVVGPTKKGAEPIERIHDLVRRSRSRRAKAVTEDQEDPV